MMKCCSTRRGWRSDAEVVKLSEKPSPDPPKSQSQCAKSSNENFATTFCHVCSLLMLEPDT
jgi:hypothetical protein